MTDLSETSIENVLMICKQYKQDQTSVFHGKKPTDEETKRFNALPVFLQRIAHTAVMNGYNLTEVMDKFEKIEQDIFDASIYPAMMEREK